MGIRMPSTTPSGEKGGPLSDAPYPWKLFVGMLLAIVIGGAILAVLLGLNPLTFQRIGSGAEPTPIATGTGVIAAATPAARAIPLIIPTTAPAVGPTAAPTPASTPATGVAPQPLRTPVAISTSPATSVPAPAGATTAAEPTTPADAATIVPTDEVQPTPVQAAVPPELAAAIIQGYDEYWSIRVRALGNPADTSIDLESVMANDELSAAYKTLAQYRDDGEAYQATVHHQIWITRATSNSAEIVDRFTATTIKLDPQTKQPVETTPQVEHITGRFLLQATNGVWKVIGRTQED
jgi:hypothetical protein